MAVSLLTNGDEWTLSLSGVVDVRDVGQLHSAAREAARGASRAVVARLEDLEALDTAATQILLALQQSLAASGRVLRVERVPSRVGDLWRCAGLADRLG